MTRKTITKSDPHVTHDTHAHEAHATHATHAAHAATMEQGTAIAPAPAQTKEAPPVTGADIVLLAPPPASANIPATPPGFVASSAGVSRGVLPKKSELAALPMAVADLGKFATYAQVLGSTVPSYSVALQAFTVANDWSSMRTQATAWDLYCQQQEGIAWKTIRAQMVRLRVAFALAVAGDPTVAATYPGLAALLGAKQAIAQKATATKLANKQAIAKGEPPIHGVIGKKRQKAAAKAALAASNAAAAAAAAATAPSSPTPTTAPATTAGSSTASSTPDATASAPPVPTGTANGAGH